VRKEQKKRSYKEEKTTRRGKDGEQKSEEVDWRRRKRISGKRNNQGKPT